MTDSSIVLVVDDDADIRGTLAELLGRESYDVRTASNGVEALALLDEVGSRPCVMLLDMMMPVTTGGELIEVLDRNHHLDTVAVIVLSARASNAHKARAVVQKPACLEHILREVRDGFAELPAPGSRIAVS